ncbi:hypothetical protein [Nocardiopsis quinghaiensis]|uniref:hypothetical protein n=1 Tax=Nocardiopsis quinghaiensis TaxID=464995 RepID=UPI001CC25D08|nr:hypothetical protein [Nocardiopsis quinghaiensis]
MDVTGLLPYLLGVFFNGLCVLTASDVLLRAWRSEGRRRFPDRWDALARLSGAFLYLLIALLMTSWAVFPVVVWYLVVALTAAAAAGVVLRWPELPARGRTGARPRGGSPRSARWCSSRRPSPRSSSSASSADGETMGGK